MKPHPFDVRPDLLDRERKRLADRHPGLALRRDSDGHWVVEGRMDVLDDRGFTVRLVVGPEYPDECPVLFVREEEVPHIDKRHVNPGGTACLCVTSEVREHWPDGSDLTDLLDGLVRNYFQYQLFFDDHGHWPQGQERSHGAKGVIECYQERLQEFGAVTAEHVAATLELMARKRDPKGHEACPCGSAKRLRDCHRDLVTDLRGRTRPRDAALDLQVLKCELATGSRGAGSLEV